MSRRNRNGRYYDCDRYEIFVSDRRNRYDRYDYYDNDEKEKDSSGIGLMLIGVMLVVVLLMM